MKSYIFSSNTREVDLKYRENGATLWACVACCSPHNRIFFGKFSWFSNQRLSLQTLLIENFSDSSPLKPLGNVSSKVSGKFKVIEGEQARNFSQQTRSAQTFAKLLQIKSHVLKRLTFHNFSRRLSAATAVAKVDKCLKTQLPTSIASKGFVKVY